jgi:hypothetical protein
MANNSIWEAPEIDGAKVLDRAPAGQNHPPDSSKQYIYTREELLALYKVGGPFDLPVVLFA